MAESPVHEFMRSIAELLARIEDGRALIDEGNYDYKQAFEMAEKQAKRISESFDWKRREAPVASGTPRRPECTDIECMDDSPHNAH